MYYKYSVIFVQPLPPMLPLLILLVQGVVALDCPGGEYWYSSQGDNYCNACPQGYYNNATDDTRFCNACAKGFWSSTSSSLACTGCLEGTYGVKLGTVSIDDCIDCPLDFHADVGAVDCYYHCRPGSYLTSSDSGPGISALHNYDRGIWEETVQVNNSNQIIQNTLTMFHNSEHAYCHQVPKGEYMDEYGTIQRELGNYYNVSEGGTYVETYGAKPCPPGKHSDVLGAVLCKTCPAGYTQPLTHQHDCNECAIGRYNNNSGLRETECTSCPHGYVNEYSVEHGKYYYDKCIYEVCQPGNYKVNEVCVVCPEGYYQEETSETVISCDACPVGMFQGSTGASSYENCAVCIRGKYQQNTGGASCLECEVGKYSDTRES